MSSYRDRFEEIKLINNKEKLNLFVEELISMVESYESVYNEFKDVIDIKFLNRNKNKTVYAENITSGNSNIKRDITVIKKK